MALTVVVIMGIMLAAVGQSWKMLTDREREQELLFRGSQYKDAITRWYKPRPGQRPAPPLADLKDLLQDPNTISTTRYLRNLYKDPMTGEDWTPIRGGSTGGIIGVFSPISSSTKKPIKQANFPKGLEDFEGKTSYSQWKFIYQQGTTTGQMETTGTTGQPGTTGGTSGAGSAGGVTGGVTTPRK
jgi:type II secretory pathway pseudopilin PulG